MPKRWAGNTLPCPKCGTRVVVPETARAEGVGTEPTAFVDAAVERSLASLQPPRPSPAGGVFSDEDFVVPEPLDPLAGARGRSGGITLPRVAIYAYGIMVPVIAIVAFLLGWWCAATGGR